jgi:hypothetical protein
MTSPARKDSFLSIITRGSTYCYRTARSPELTQATGAEYLRLRAAPGQQGTHAAEPDRIGRRNRGCRRILSVTGVDQSQAISASPAAAITSVAAPINHADLRAHRIALTPPPTAVGEPPSHAPPPTPRRPAPSRERYGKEHGGCAAAPSSRSPYQDRLRAASTGLAS